MTERAATLCTPPRNKIWIVQTALGIGVRVRERALAE